jgi:hypothetical protein
MDDGPDANIGLGLLLQLLLTGSAVVWAVADGVLIRRRVSV